MFKKYSCVFIIVYLTFFLIGMLFLMQLCYEVDDTGAAYESRQYFIIQELERRGMKLYDLNEPLVFYLLLL